MNIDISYYTACGHRHKNEDTVSILEGVHGTLAIVADGLGGHSDGEIASRQAVATLNAVLQARPLSEDSLIDAIEQASTEIYRLRKEQSTMRTTIAALWIGEHIAIAANVGDSRIYQFRDDEIVYQSVDHSVAQLAVLLGEICADELRTNQDRNKLIRVLGDEVAPKVDTAILSLQQGDCLLLCSDGFWNAITEKDMIKKDRSAQQWLKRMRGIVEAQNLPEQDNHSAIALIIE